MNTVNNGKGDRPRNNWSTGWYEGYDTIDWHRKKQQPTPATGQRFRRAEDAGESNPRQPAWPGMAEPLRAFAEATTGFSGGQSKERPVTQANLNFGRVEGDAHWRWGINE